MRRLVAALCTIFSTGTSAAPSSLCARIFETAWPVTVVRKQASAEAQAVWIENLRWVSTHNSAPRGLEVTFAARLIGPQTVVAPSVEVLQSTADAPDSLAVAEYFFRFPLEAIDSHRPELVRPLEIGRFNLTIPAVLRRTLAAPAPSARSGFYFYFYAGEEDGLDVWLPYELDVTDVRAVSFAARPRFLIRRGQLQSPSLPNLSEIETEQIFDMLKWRD
jgi:hypothetical protein